jgi:hypothetical protein
MAKSDKEKRAEGTDTSDMTEEEKRAASRERIKSQLPEHEIHRTRTGQGRNLTNKDLETQMNGKHAKGQTWKQVVEEEKEQKGKKQR